jgi:multidrug efflux pump subunit AcrB/outer membrane protein TolC
MHAQTHNLYERAMTHWRIIVTFVAVLLAYGVVSFLTMPRQEFPTFTIRQGLVIAVMPGASSDEIEEQITKPVETYLFSFEEVNKKKTYSQSQDGQMVVFVELNEKISGQEAPAFWAKLRHGLNELKTQKLPSQTLALIGNNDFGDTSALLLTLTAEGRSPRDLQKYVEILEKHLRRVEATSKLRRVGEQQETIRVSISRDRLARYGVRPATVWASLQGLGSLPANARLDGTELELPVYVGKVLHSEKELGDAIILSSPDGSNVRLKDVAQIVREYGHDDSFVRYNGKTALVLSVEMQPGHDITRFGKELDQAIAAARAELPQSVQIARVADQPKVVGDSINHFLRDFGLAIVSVIAVTMLLLPLRVATVAAVTIPISIFITLGVLNMLRVKLETVSLAGLIVVLGMVVDNAIVVIDDHVEKLDHGMTPWKAAWKSASELVVPIFTATLAIIMAYTPMAYLLTGQAGEFVTNLPITIAAALAVSLLVAALLVPVMNNRLIRQGIRSHGAQDKKSLLDRLQGWFDFALERAFRHPWVTVGAGLASIVGSGLLAASLPQQLFPKAERNQFAVEVYLPSGRSLEQTDAVVKRIESQLKGDKRVVGYTSFVGTSSPRFHTLYAPNMPARNYAQLVVNTTTDDAVVEVLEEYNRKFNGTFPEAWVRWKQLDMQSTKAPIEIRLSGEEIPSLRAMAQNIEHYAKSLSDVTWVRNDFEEPLQAIEVAADTDACSRLSVSPASLRSSLALGLQGFPIGTVWEGDYPVKVLLKDEAKAISTIDGLRQQYVSTMLLGATVPLEQLAKLVPVWKEGVIVHRNGVRTLTVRVDIAPGKLASPVFEKLRRYIKTLDLAPGVTIDYGGETEGMNEVMVPLAQSLVASVGFIYLILLCQFKRHSKVLLVMMTMPLSLFGDVLGLKLAHYPFGLTAFIGIIGLMGIVVRNGIILVGYAEELREKHGMSAFDAALAAGKRRMRPIYLTSMAAAIGVIPMILGRSTLWGPLGTVTCFGLLTSMVLTLFVLPVAYWLVTRNERPLTPPANQEHPAPNAVVAPVAAAVTALALLLLPVEAHADTSLTLAQARSLALANNSQVKQANIEIAASEQTRKAAFTKYLPKVSADAMGAVFAKPLVNTRTGDVNLPVYDGNSANLPNANQFAFFPNQTIRGGDRALLLSITAIQPLYVGGRISNGNRLAKLGVEVARAKADVAERDALLATEEKYWQIVSLHEKRRTIVSYQALLEALEKQVNDAHKSGLTTQNDLLKVRLKQQEVAVNRLRIEQGIELATRDLRRHVGLPGSERVQVTDPLLPEEYPSALASLRQGAAERRLEIHLIEQAIAAEGLQRSLSEGEMLPSVAVGASAMHLQTNGIDAINNGCVFGTVSVPISGIWEGSYQRSAHAERIRGLEEKRSEVRELIALESQKYWDELWTAWQNSKVTGYAVGQSEVNVNEVSDRYNNGLAPFSDLLEAEALRQEALDHTIDNRAEYWSKRSAFLRAVGKDAR